MKNFGIKSLQRYITETGNEIIYCEADGRYTHVYFSNDKHEMISANIESIKKLLNDADFFRSHKSHLVNLKYLIGVNCDKRNIYLKNGYVAKVSARKVSKIKYLMANRK